MSGAENTAKMQVGEYTLKLLLGFLTGAAVAAFGIPTEGIVIGGLLAIIWVQYFKQIKLVMLCLAGGAFIFGILYFHLYAQGSVTFLRLPQDSPATFEGLVVEEPRNANRFARFTIELQEPYRGKIGVIDEASGIQYGDVLRLEGRIRIENGEIIAKFPKTERLARNKGHWLKEQLLAVKRGVIQSFERALPPDEAALLSGITLGARSSFSPKLKEDMAISGTIHIVAVSGYNISILAIVLGSAAALFMRRRIAIWVAVIGILLFVGIVGSEASVVRAAIMGILGLLAEGTGRPNNQAYAIALAASLMVAWDPTIIRNDLGFMLSFLSLLGVTYLSPALQSLWRNAKDKGFFAWKENLDTTLGAQLGVLPVLLLTFGSVSATSLLANILIIPLIPITMGVGFLLGIIQWLSPLLAFPVTEIARLLTGYEIWVIQFFADTAIPIGNFFAYPVVIIAYYLFFAAFIAYRNKKGEIKLTEPSAIKNLWS